MTIRDRTGFDAGGMRLEEALEWAARHGFHHIDCNADLQPNHRDSWDAARVHAIRQYCAQNDIHLGLHTASAVHEVHYLGHTVAACRYYFDAIASAHFGWPFTVNHAHLVPEDIDGFLDAFGVTRIGEVRLADNLGQGNIDFTALFQRLESSGYQHHYMMAFGSPEDKLAGRDYLSDCWPEG